MTKSKGVTNMICCSSKIDLCLTIQLMKNQQRIHSFGWSKPNTLVCRLTAFCMRATAWSCWHCDFNVNAWFSMLVSVSGCSSPSTSNLHSPTYSVPVRTDCADPCGLRTELLGVRVIPHGLRSPSESVCTLHKNCTWPGLNQAFNSGTNSSR